MLVLLMGGIFSWSYFLTGAFAYTKEVQNLSTDGPVRPAWTSDLQVYIQKAVGNILDNQEATLVYLGLGLVFGWVLWKAIRFGLIGILIMLVVMLTYPKVAEEVAPAPRERNSAYLELTGSDKQIYAGEEYPLLAVSILWTFLFLGGAWVATSPSKVYV